MYKIKYCLFALILTAVTLSFNNTAFAIPCGSGGVSGSVSCQDGIGKNDKTPGGVAVTVNNESFFGFSDWLFLQKDNEGSLETNISTDWTITPEDGGWADDKGDWSFLSNVWDNYTDVMIVLKGGNHNGVYFSGYLLDNELEPINSTWDTGGRDVSHLTLYARNQNQPPDSPPIPEPGILLMLGSGFFVFYGFRKK